MSFIDKLVPMMRVNLLEYIDAIKDYIKKSGYLLFEGNRYYEVAIYIDDAKLISKPYITISPSEYGVAATMDPCIDKYLNKEIALIRFERDALNFKLNIIVEVVG